MLSVGLEKVLGHAVSWEGRGLHRAYNSQHTLPGVSCVCLPWLGVLWRGPMSEWKERKSWKGSEGWLSGTVVSLRGRSLGSQTVPSPLSGPRRAAVQIRSYRGQSISAARVLRRRTVPRLGTPSGLGVHLGPRSVLPNCP